MEKDNIIRDIIQTSYHPKNVFFQRNSSLIRSLHYYHDNIQKLNQSQASGSPLVNRLKDLNMDESVQNQIASPSNSVSSLHQGSGLAREPGRNRIKPIAYSLTMRSNVEDSPKTTFREGVKLPSLSADQRGETKDESGKVAAQRTLQESSLSDPYTFHSSFERRMDTNTKWSNDKILNTSSISLFGMKKCTCCNLYEDKEEFIKKYIKGLVKSKKICSLKSSVNFADYMENFNQDVSHLMDKKKTKKSEDRKTEKFMSTINTFYKQRNNLADDGEAVREKGKAGYHARGKSEDIANYMTLELKKEIPNSMTAVPSGRQEAQKLKGWVLEKESALMESMKETNEKGELLRRLQDLYKLGTQELIRQLNTECLERGELLMFIWNRIESLIESHVRNLDYFKEKIRDDAEKISSTIVGVVEKRIEDKDAVIHELKEIAKKKDKEIAGLENEIKEGNKLSKTLREKINTRNKAILIYKESVRVLQNQNQQFRNRIEQLRSLETDKGKNAWPEEDENDDLTPAVNIHSKTGKPGEKGASRKKSVQSQFSQRGSDAKGESRGSIIKIIPAGDSARGSIKRSSTLKVPESDEEKEKKDPSPALGENVSLLIEEDKRRGSLDVIEEGSKDTLGEDDLTPNIELGAISKKEENEEEEDDQSSLNSNKELLKDEEVDELIINARNGEGTPRRRKSFIKIGELNSVFSFCMPDRLPETCDVDTYVHPSDLPESHSEQGVQTKLVLMDKKFDNLTKNAYIFEDLVNDYLYKKEFENMMLDEGKMLELDHGEEFLKVISEINKVASNIKSEYEGEDKPPQNILEVTAEKHVLRQASAVGKLMMGKKVNDGSLKDGGNQAVELAEVEEEGEKSNKPRSKTAHMNNRSKVKSKKNVLLVPAQKDNEHLDSKDEKAKKEEEEEKKDGEASGEDPSESDEEENYGPVKPKLKDIVNRLKRSKNKMIKLNNAAKEGEKSLESPKKIEKKSLNKSILKSLIPNDENAARRQNFQLLIGFNKTMNEMKNTVKRAIRLYMAEKFKTKQFEEKMNENRETLDREKKEKNEWESERLALQQRILELEFMAKGAPSNPEFAKYNEGRRFAATQLKLKPDAATLIQFKARAPKVRNRKIYAQDGPSNNVQKRRQQDQTGTDIVNELKVKGVSDFHNFMPLKVLLRHISQIYADKVQLKKESVNQEFPDFVYNFMLKYYGFKKIAQQKFIVFLLSLRKHLVLLRVQNMAKFMNLLEAGNFNKADTDKFIDMVDYFSTGGDRTYINNEADSKYLVPFAKAWEYVRSFLEGKISSEEMFDFKREVDSLKEIDQRTTNQKLILIDIDVLFLKFLAKYKSVMNATKDFAIKVFRAVDLYGSNMCSLGEFVLLAKHIESEFFKGEETAEKMFNEYSDIELENERYLSLEKFTNLCAEKDLFSDAQQHKFLEARGNSDISNIFKQLQEKWTGKAKDIETRLEKLGLLDDKIAEDWRSILDIIAQRVQNGTEEVKSTLLAFKLINQETQRLVESQGIE